MQQTQIMEDKVRSAVKDFACSINSESKIVADMSSLVEATSQLPLSNLDYWERLIRNEFSRCTDNSCQSTWKLWSKPRELLTWLDLTSWDGYKREKTLRALSGAAPNAFFFLIAIRRLNDWVPQVREAAREKLPEIAIATDPTHVVEALCITLSNWNSWGRIEEADKNVLLHIISRNEIAEALKSKLITATAGPMTSLFSQLGRTSILDNYIEEISTRAIQPSLRAKAFRCLFEGRIVWIEGRKWEWTDIRYNEGRYKAVVSERKIDVNPLFLKLLKQSSEDRSSIVRRVSAEFLIRELGNMGDESKTYAQKFASDESNPVSERGRFALRKLECDFT
ncbi:hypothetical protein [Litoribacillus peritrichatus]|uniref:Uncharacterized protein n=1 Tax=Litoribacillus peritrichatus TaxID=718191 RepID=A0ABP7N4L2_9GAMM